MKKELSGVSVSLLMIFGTVILGGCTGSRPNSDVLKAYISAKSSYEHGQFGDAKTALQTILKNSPDFFQARFLEAKSEFLLNDFKAAETSLTQVIQNHPDHLQARFWLALVELQTGRTDAAAKRLDNLLSLDPQDYRLLYERGLLYLRQGDLKNALDFFHQATLDESDLAKSRLEAGRVLYGLGDEKKALEQLQRARVLVSEHQGLISTLDTMIKTIQHDEKHSHEAKASK